MWQWLVFTTQNTINNSTVVNSKNSGGAKGHVVRSKARGWGAGVAWRGGVGLGLELGGVGGGTAGVVVLGELCAQQVAVQCVVRVAAKHWASGLQGTVGGTVGRSRGR